MHKRKNKKQYIVPCYLWLAIGALCGQDITPYGSKPIFWKIIVHSNYCWEKRKCLVLKLILPSLTQTKILWHVRQVLGREPLPRESTRASRSVQVNSVRLVGRTTWLNIMETWIWNERTKLKSKCCRALTPWEGASSITSLQHVVGATLIVTTNTLEEVY